MITTVLDLLEERYPCGHSLRQGDKVGVIIGYDARGSKDSRVIVRFEDDSEKKIPVKLDEGT